MAAISHRDLFVPELANNLWGRLARGLKTIRGHTLVVHFNKFKAVI